MANRIFAAVLLVVTLGYAVIAFTAIKAPFQYDPLGPESWPRILSIVAILCLIVILWKPDDEAFDVTRKVWFRLTAAVAMLFGYAELYEPLGFILATILFGTALCAMLGAGMLRSVVFGVAAGEQRPRLSGKGVDAFEPFAGRRVGPFAADVHLVFFEFGHVVLPTFRPTKPGGSVV